MQIRIFGAPFVLEIDDLAGFHGFVGSKSHFQGLHRVGVGGTDAARVAGLHGVNERAIQIEGLVIDKGIHMGHLKGTLDAFASRLYGEGITTRFRPSYFPFTEPSAEVDLTCANCKGAGCRVCKGTGWIEVLGAGMVNPKVLEMCGIDPGKYTGFAFGIGIERITMLKYGVPNMKYLWENDVRFLKQFR